jgi:hypothetical protein
MRAALSGFARKETGNKRAGLVPRRALSQAKLAA